MDSLSLTKKPKTYDGKKECIFNKWCWSNQWCSCRKMQIVPYLPHYTILKYKWIKDLHMKPDTLNLIEEKMTNSLELIGTGDNFLNRTPMAQAL